jgi:hypothetical protein
MRILLLVLAVSLPLAYATWQRVLPSPDRPSPTVTSGQRLILPSMRVPADPSFAFLLTQPASTEPVAFDPCRPVHYVVRPDGAPAGGLELLPQALAEVSAATGLQFIDDGATDEAPAASRPNFLPDRYGDRWAPVLIAWSTPAEFSELSGPVIGLAGSEPVSADGDQLALVSGQVVLDADQLGEVLSLNGGRAVAVATITHELGHLVGLAHVSDQRQLMYPSARPLVATFGRGDLTGLAALGLGRCFESL